MNWIQRLFTRRSIYNDLSEEMQQHLEEKIEALIADGMSREEAAHAARREFGNVMLLEEQGREAWQWPRLESIWTDIRYALRQLRKSPGITLIALLTLALGIGANTAVFTLTWSILLQSLPVPEPDRLVQYEMSSSETMIGLSGPEYTALRHQQKTSIDLLAWDGEQLQVRRNTQEKEEPVQFLTGNAFRVLELQPHLGNFFTEQQDAGGGQQSTPAILSYDYWRSQFQGDEHALGQSLMINDHPVTVIGVMPPAFEGLTANFHPAVYLPMSFTDVLYSKDYRTNPGNFPLFVMGRLKPGVTLANAAAEIKAIEPSVRKDADPSGLFMNQFFASFRLTMKPGRSGVSWLKEAFTRPLLVLEMLVVFLLALCCINTALVMFARVSGRQQEYALRSALGARPARLIRQVLIETVLLALPGLIGGVFFGWLAAHALVSMLGDRGTPSAIDLRPNAIILGVNLAATALVALGAGLWPALRAAGTAPSLDLKAGERGIAAKHIGGWAISLQVAVSLCLVAAAVLLGGTLGGLLTTHSGLRPQRAAMATIDLSPLKLTDAEAAGLSSRLLHAVQAKPGVAAAGFIDIPPFSGSFGASRVFSIDSDHVIHTQPHIFYVQATPGYFAAAGTHVLGGKIEAGSTETDRTCVLSQSAARFFFPHQSALGQLVYFSTWPQPDGSNLAPENAGRVVAVVEDAKFVSLREPAPQMYYSVLRPDVPAQKTVTDNYLIVRAGSDALALAAIEDAVREVLPPAASVKSQSLTQLQNHDLSRERMLVSLSTVFAVLALLLTALGLYGLLMRAVVLRTREIGIRIALGAQPRTILLAIGQRVLFEVGLGLSVGVLISVLITRLVRQLLQTPQASGAGGYVLSAALILAVSLLAALAPAHRAASVDPMQALRTE